MLVSTKGLCEFDDLRSLKIATSQAGVQHYAVDTNVSVPRTASGAESAAQYAKLKEFYRQARDYGAGGVKQLENGRYRFYGKLDPADKVGEMAGRRFVK
jgi:hypothetical protein